MISIHVSMLDDLHLLLLSSQTPWEYMSPGEGQSKDTREKERWGGRGSLIESRLHACSCHGDLCRPASQMNRAANRGKKKMLSKPTCAHTTTPIQFSLINSWIYCLFTDFKLVYQIKNRISFDGQERLLQQHARYTTVPNNRPQHVVNKSAYTCRNRHTYTYTKHTHTHTERYQIQHVPGSVAMETPGRAPLLSPFESK